MIPTEYGGRSTSAFSGYRGQFFWHINNEPCTDWLAETYFEGDSLEPGKSCKVKIRLTGTILELGKKDGFNIGRQFALREGSKIVAVGVITESIYNTAQPSN